VLTINSLVRLHDVIATLTDQLGLPAVSSKAMRFANIIIKLREINKSGGNPMIIVDEAENMEHSLLKMIKGFFDGLAGYASIVLIGTDQLRRDMEKAKNRNVQGGPQLWRRFKPFLEKSFYNIPDFQPFFDELVADYELRKLLTRLCDNYGELNQYLEPALRECDERGEALTVDKFREIYNIQ
jgi:hypothetical protein